MSEQELDGGRPHVHVRCGSDIADGLTAAGFVGRFLEFADPYCCGPVPSVRDEALLAARGAYLASALDVQGAHERLRREHDRLEAAARGDDRLVLWFEHDSYDQLILARVLSLVGRHRPDGRDVELIAVANHPSVDNFRGLGQLAPDALVDVWGHRRPVSAAAIELGERVFAAVAASAPTQLARLAAAGTPEVPVMARALQRHLEELPWLHTGLSRTQRLCLDIACERPGTAFGALFRELNEVREPLPFLGDAMCFAILRELAEASTPLVAIAGDAYPHHTVVPTAAGRAVAGGQRDFARDCGPAERFVGGVSAASGWRWDPDAGCPVRP